MVFVASAREFKQGILPVITHEDISEHLETILQVQNPRYRALIPRLANGPALPSWSRHHST
jgi:hypothetical protein